MNIGIINKGLQYQYIHNKKKNYKINNINLYRFNLNYSKFVNQIIKNEIKINNKILSQLFISENVSIKSLIYIIK
uniref:Ribosomal protein L20 n=1 Tax=Malawimonas jakobiformis TaxID=136089 RepID=Q9G887_MALJA|nr:ribosomal protein L20 [Malawimonas jakobiformis]AAG13686.1 ribosomal protein L20 [Malawimonas jakobiformis]